MTSTKITIPDFDFASFYYPEILEALMNYKRTNVPEMTDETPYEPFIQLLRAYALVGHLNNTTLDLIANEAYLETAQLVESVREHLKLIDYQMKPAVPSQTDEVFELSKTFTSITEIVPENSLFSTAAIGDEQPVYFEVIDSQSVADTNVFSNVFAYEEDGEGATWVDYTTEANAGTNWTPWVSAVVGDAVYFGHADIMWDKMVVETPTQAAGIAGIFEYYGNHYYKVTPSLVTNPSAGILEFNVNAMLGIANRVGTDVRVTLNSTGASEDLVSTWDGSDNIVTTTGLLGQSTVSLTEADYTLSMPWYELSDVDDKTLDFTVDDKAISFALPQNVTEYWQQTEVNDETAYWLRYRIITGPATTNPVFAQWTIDDGKQYYLASATQGKTQLDDPLALGTGLADQKYDLSREYFVLNSQEVTVDAEEWAEVDNFLASAPTNKHYTVTLGDNDRATINFGNGVSGSIPSNGATITAEYRHNAELDGNVGSDTVTSDKTGLIYTNKIWNPRSASGWSASQGSTDQGIAQAKIEGPASLRIKEVALNADDAASLAVSYIDDDGLSPFTRATAFEGTYGPKTIELVVTAAGGALASSEQIQGVEDYFNGDRTSTPPKPKRIVANQELSATNYSQKTIDVTATVYGNVSEEAVENALIALLQPEAVEPDGVTWTWKYGGEVTKSRLNHEIFGIDNSIWKVLIDESDVELATRELPIAGSITVTVIEGSG